MGSPSESNNLLPTDLSEHPGYSRVFQPDALTFGLITPIEGYGHSPSPKMENHVAIAKAAEKLGFAAIWLRDVPLFDPGFNDVGQIFDPIAYAGYLAALTSEIVIGTAGIVMPLRDPLTIAKQATSLDQLTGGRFILGLSSGDRPIEYPIFGVNYHERGTRYREAREIIRAVTETDFPRYNTEQFGSLVGQVDLVPKPFVRRLPTVAIGRAGQQVDWLAKEMDGWIWHGFDHSHVPKIIEMWRNSNKQHCFKPFGYGTYFDLSADPDEPMFVRGVMMRGGRKSLIDFWKRQRDQGVSHVALNLRVSRRPAIDVLQELGEHVLPQFPTVISRY
ncbi:LLM class oxidoreductase [Paraburkholderia sp. GAS334]|uniref:LLM class oxidoreductase n=1 Tax=Paraburkholderia sp. GAS334 TaxID=3035131 RepID=UPI003D206635